MADSQCPWKADHVCIDNREGVNDIINGWYSRTPRCKKITNDRDTIMNYDDDYNMWSIHFQRNSLDSTLAFCLNENILDCSWYIYNGSGFELDPDTSASRCSHDINSQFYYNQSVFSNMNITNWTQVAPGTLNVTCSEQSKYTVFKADPENLLFLTIIAFPICFLICWGLNILFTQNLQRKKKYDTEDFDVQRLNNFDKCGPCTIIGLIVKSFTLTLGISTIVYVWIILFKYPICGDYGALGWNSMIVRLFKIFNIFGWFAIWKVSITNTYRKSNNNYQKAKKYFIHIFFTLASTACAITWYLSDDIGNVTWINVDILEKCTCCVTPKFWKEAQSDSEYYNVIENVLYWAVFGMGIVPIISFCMACSKNWWNTDKMSEFIPLIILLIVYTAMIIAMTLAKSLSLVYSFKVLQQYGIRLDWNDVIFIIIVISSIIYGFGEWWNSRKQRKQKVQENGNMDQQIEFAAVDTAQDDTQYNKYI